jgi:hypothetical protein
LRFGFLLGICAVGLTGFDVGFDIVGFDTVGFDIVGFDTVGFDIVGFDTVHHKCI